MFSSRGAVAKQKTGVKTMLKACGSMVKNHVGHWRFAYDANYLIHLFPAAPWGLQSPGFVRCYSLVMGEPPKGQISNLSVTRCGT